MIITYNKENCEKRNFPEKILKGIKKHTIREDKTNRWKVGRTMQHYAMNPRNGGKQFAEGICTGVFKIEILPSRDMITVWSNIHPLHSHNLYHIDVLNKFAVEDGFEDWKEMKEFFKTYFSGVVIWWDPKEIKEIKCKE